jgi:hypothetical protein
MCVSMLQYMPLPLGRYRTRVPVVHYTWIAAGTHVRTSGSQLQEAGATRNACRPKQHGRYHERTHSHS